jgi:hypothetical protein
MRPVLFRLIVAGLAVLATPAWGSEELIYAVVHKASDYRASKTEIFSIDPRSAERQLVFSDEKTQVMLLQRLYVFHFPVAGGRKLFAHAAQRGTSVPFPGNDSLYELSTDGSHSFRRIAPVSGNESLGEIFVNSAGTRIGYINCLKRRQYVFIHDVATGKLLHQVDVTDTFLDCFASGIGWLPRSETLFFSLEAGDVHITSEESYDKVGTYTMHESGANLTKLGDPPVREGFWPPGTTRMIGVLTTGERVLETMQHRKPPGGEGPRTLFAVVKMGPGSEPAEDIGFSPGCSLYAGIRVSYLLSPSGKYLAAAALPVSSSATSGDIWLKDLEAGEEEKLLSIPTNGLQGPFLGLVGWIDW